MNGIVAVQRMSPLKISRRIARRCYHELSFAAHGEPASVVDFVNLPDIGDEDPPSYLKDAVRVEMWHAPLNPADINTIQGKYPSLSDDEATRIRQSRFEPGRTVAGSEGWGCVTHIVGDTFGIKVGDVVVIGQPGLGTFRSSFWTPATSVLPLEQGHQLRELFGAQTAAVPQMGGTALRMLRDFVALQPGDVVIQNAGNSGVGFMASQLGSALLDVSVVSIARRAGRSGAQWQELVDHLMSEGKCAMVVAEEDLDSREAINELQIELKRLSRTGRLPMLALNAVGGQSASILCKYLDTEGTMVTYGGMSMKPVTMSTPQFIFKDLRAVGYWHSRWMVQNSLSERQQLVDELVNAISRENIQCPPVKEFPLSRADEALTFTNEKSTIRQKVVFQCQE